MNEMKLGLRENWRQFSLLVLINAFVGGMVGLERSIFPEYAHSVFGLNSNTAVLSFIVAFGISKAIANYFTGKMANKIGRKNVLIYGWLLALPIPFMLMYTNSWNVVLFSNVLLGLSQGMTWSSTVVMKIDLVGDKNRGLAMGINEFAGYFAVGVFAFLSAVIAEKYGIRPFPFYLGVVLSICGLFLSIFFLKDTLSFVHKEADKNRISPMKNVFLETSFKNKNLSSITQAGLVNNLNDGMIWGLLPMLLFSLDFTTQKTGVITGLYPMIWGIGQLFTGKMGDHYSKKKLLFIGMLIQAIAILFLPYFETYPPFLILSVTLGLGTALVYPNFLSAIAASTTPQQRAESIGTFRLWRDLGYVFGALLSGFIADRFGINYAFLAIGAITLLSALQIQLRMTENH